MTDPDFDDFINFNDNNPLQHDAICRGARPLLYHRRYVAPVPFDPDSYSKLLQRDRGIYDDSVRHSSSATSLTPISLKREETSLEELEEISRYSTRKAYPSPEPRRYRACAGCQQRKITCDSQSTNEWPCASCTRLNIECFPPVESSPLPERGPGAYPPFSTGLTASHGGNLKRLRTSDSPSHGGKLKRLRTSDIRLRTVPPIIHKSIKSSSADSAMYPCVFSLLPCDFKNANSFIVLQHSLGHLYNTDLQSSIRHEFQFAHKCPMCDHDFAVSSAGLLFWNFITHVSMKHESFFLDIRIGPKLYKRFVEAGIISQYQYSIIESICVWESKRRPLHEVPESTSDTKRSLFEYKSMTPGAEEAGVAATSTPPSSSDEEGEGQGSLLKDPGAALDKKLDVSARSVPSPTDAVQEMADPATIAPVIISESGSPSEKDVESDNFADHIITHMIEDRIPAQKDDDVGSSSAEQISFNEPSLGDRSDLAVTETFDVPSDTYMSRLTRGYKMLMGARGRDSQRIEWDCDCGERLHWNTQNISQEQAKMLSSYLDRTNDTTDSASSNETPNGGSLSNTDSRGSSPSQRSTPPSSVDGKPDGNGDIRITVDPVIDNGPIESVLRRQYFELCVSNGSYRKKLIELNITDTKSDGEFFKAIFDKYHEHRVSQTWSCWWLPLCLRSRVQKQRRQWLLKKPSSKEFRKFMLDQGTTIGLCASELPPPEEVSNQRYHYIPCPLVNIEEVIPDHIFFHLFYDPAPHYNSKWMRRLPKKLDQSIFDSTDQIPVGWGMHIVETANLHIVLLALLIGLIISGVVAVVYACKMRDVQGGFGIGAYFATVLTVWMSAMYFKWSQE